MIKRKYIEVNRGGLNELSEKTNFKLTEGLSVLWWHELMLWV